MGGASISQRQEGGVKWRGPRNEAQLVENIGAVGWRLADEHIAALDAASATMPPYPFWHQRNFPMLAAEGAA
ncbi:hypothetical protein SAMN06295912_1077 [Sphingomonas laterariae]|uniref:Aldo/keto reductase family protein n=1 Tax=Edaphosphingomonas laterariae TaxID=861865 RepID=A0A239ENV0_9SPHN|nr:hypothetical protein SAMN06295912_1077 [Sphingomonas laterariae]